MLCGLWSVPVVGAQRGQRALRGAVLAAAVRLAEPGGTSLAALGGYVANHRVSTGISALHVGLGFTVGDLEPAPTPRYWSACGKLEGEGRKAASPGSRRERPPVIDFLL